MKRKIVFTKKKILMILLLVLVLFFMNKVSSSHVGQGEITKLCTYMDETPVEGARVVLDGTGLELFTDSLGKAVFMDLDAGIYTILVDVDLDGVWDGDPDIVVLASGGSEFVHNWFPLPKTWGFEIL